MSVVGLLYTTGLGEAERVTVGVATVTVTDCKGDVPPGPVHWNVNVVGPPIGFVRPLPESVPELVHGPPAVQEVAFVDDQVSVDCPFGATGFGEAVSEAVAAAGTHEFEFCVQVPLVQVKLQAPAKPRSHEPAVDPDAVVGNLQPDIVTAAQEADDVVNCTSAP